MCGEHPERFESVGDFTPVVSGANVLQQHVTGTEHDVDGLFVELPFLTPERIQHVFKAMSQLRGSLITHRC